jgi:hypothetical protein
VYIVLNTLFNPHFNFNRAWVTHDRFLESTQRLPGWTTDVPRNLVQSTEEEEEEEEEREKKNFI